jgi:hypothetical protein
VAEAFNTYFLSIADNIVNNKNQDHIKNKDNTINNNNSMQVMLQPLNTAYPHMKHKPNITTKTDKIIKSLKAEDSH